MRKNYKQLLTAGFILGFGILSLNKAKATIFNNTAVLTVIDGAPASAYPSVINVSGMAGTISNLTVTLKNVSHDYVQDMSVMLTGPNGKTLLLQSSAGDPNSVTNITYTFSDAGATQMPATGVLTSTTYKPTGHMWDIWDAPAPPTPPGVGTYYIPGPFNAGLPLSTLASVFNGSTPNGQWKLWVQDFSNGGDPGVISGGWSINITTAILTPVTLQDFKAVSLGCKVGLSWKTEDETDCSHFDIERSMNNGEFVKIGSINAKGRSVVATEYSFVDQDVNADAHYEYRLNVVDIDGHSGYSDISAVDLKCANQSVSLFPNPANDFTTLMIKDANAETVSVQITDIFGHVLYASQVEINNETKRIQLPVASFAKGLYMVHVNSESIQENIQFSKN